MRPNVQKPHIIIMTIIKFRLQKKIIPIIIMSETTKQTLNSHFLPNLSNSGGIIKVPDVQPIKKELPIKPNFVEKTQVKSKVSTQL